VSQGVRVSRLSSMEAARVDGTTLAMSCGRDEIVLLEVCLSPVCHAWCERSL